jgi:alkanesulfonate monooxygenase SsuD/methylene tetrahydromethanopterin reductase-like flavin-dependent oxidoreductase (luciferase family)
MLAAFVAAKTTRIRVGPAVVVVPLHHPIRILEELALLDQLSDGRVSIGLGGGYQEFEFHKFGADMANNRAAFADFMQIFHQYTTTGVVEHVGEVSSIPRTAFTLRLKQRRPAVFIASGTSEPAVQRRMVDGGYASIVSMVGNTTAAMVERHRAINRAYRAAGGTAERMPFAYNQYMYVTHDPVQARRAAESVLYVMRVHAAMKSKDVQLDGSFMKDVPFEGEPSVETLLGRLAIGDPSTVAERLQEQMKQMQPTTMSFIMGLPGISHADVMQSMECFATDVMPGLCRLGTALGGARITAAATET